MFMALLVVEHMVAVKEINVTDGTEILLHIVE